jgi:hypothetical protein
MKSFVRKMWFYGLIFDVFQNFDKCGCISKLVLKNIWELCLWIITITHLITFAVYSYFKITIQHWFFIMLPMHVLVHPIYSLHFLHDEDAWKTRNEIMSTIVSWFCLIMASWNFKPIIIKKIPWNFQKRFKII